MSEHAQLCSNNNFMDTEIRISCNFYIKKYFYFAQPFKNVKTILSSWVVQKQQQAGCGHRPQFAQGLENEQVRGPAKSCGSDPSERMRVVGVGAAKREKISGDQESRIGCRGAAES